MHDGWVIWDASIARPTQYWMAPVFPTYVGMDAIQYKPTYEVGYLVVHYWSIQYMMYIQARALLIRPSRRPVLVDS